MWGRQHRDSKYDAVRVVIVTGASRGIGLEVCRQFSQRGAGIGMIARDPEALEAARRLLPGPARAEVADVADAGAVAGAVARIQAELGPVDVLVNNAGHGHWAAVIDTGADDFRRAIEVNYLGAAHAVAAVLPGMVRRRHGHIVNVVSIAGRIGTPFEAAYSASKFALVGYSEALAVELAGTGVEVSLVAPGPVDTGFASGAGATRRRGGPRPIAAARVAAAVLSAVDGRRREQFLPRWLRLAVVVKTVAPVTHRIGTRWMYAPSRRAMRERASV